MSTLKKAFQGSLLASSLVLAGCERTPPATSTPTPSPTPQKAEAPKEQKETNPFLNVPKEVPKEFDNGYGRTVDIQKLLQEVGDHKDELASWFAVARGIIDKNSVNDKAVDLTGEFSPGRQRVEQLFPELKIENARILSDGLLIKQGTKVENWTPEKQKKYDELMKLETIPFFNYIFTYRDNAGMHDARDPKSDLDKQWIKAARDVFDLYARFFSQK